VQNGPKSEDVENIRTRCKIGEYKANINCIFAVMLSSSVCRCTRALLRGPDQIWIKGSHLSPSEFEGFPLTGIGNEEEVSLAGRKPHGLGHRKP
jgi:hypothetical protein